MDTGASDTPTAETVVSTLQAHAAELRAAGIRRLSVFGSVARGEAGPESDVDLLAELTDAHLSLIGLAGIEIPETCLTEILDDIARAARFTAGMSREAFAANEMATYAAERCLQRICEAASRLGSMAAELMPRQPLAKIRGMGNRLCHAYDTLDLAATGTCCKPICRASKSMSSVHWHPYGRSSAPRQ